MATNETQVPMVLGVIIPLTCLALFVVTLRVFTRAVLVGKIGVDDYCAIISFILIFACTFVVFWGKIYQNSLQIRVCLAYNLLGINYGFGTHMASLTHHQQTSYLKVFYSSTILYTVAITAIRMTFLAQYHRAFASKETQKALIVATAIVSGWCVSQICIAIFTCQPISTFWNRGNGGKCLSINPIWYINAAGNITTDLIIIVVPLPCLVKLRLAPRQRYVLVAIFCLGLFTCVISAIRIRYIVRSSDLTWVNPDLSAWSIAELCCGLLCACLPTLRPLVSRLMPKILGLRQTPINTEQRQEHVSSHTYRDIELDNGMERRSTSKRSQHEFDNQETEAGERMSIDIVLDDDERRLTGVSISKPQPAEIRWLRY